MNEKLIKLKMQKGKKIEADILGEKKKKRECMYCIDSRAMIFFLHLRVCVLFVFFF